MSWIRSHLGDWIALHAHAERMPPRLTIDLTLGELPQTWARSRHPRTRTWTGLVGLVLIAPFAAASAAAVLRSLGLTAPFDWIASSSIAIIAASISLFFGIPMAIATNIWRITRVGVRRRHGELDGLLAFEFAPLHILVVVIALAIAGVFVGHLAADAYACWNGVRSAC